MTRSARHFTNTNIKVEPGVDLQPNEWYRSPLSEYDHMLGLFAAWITEGIAWCGFDLVTCRDWEDATYGGLWYSDRKGGNCAECARRQEEWDAIK